MIDTKKETKHIQVFESLTEFSASVPRVWKESSYEKRQEWSGNQTMAEAFERLKTGSQAGQAQADRFLAELEDLTEMRTSYPAWEYSVAGAIPCVPSYLSGDPESMRRQVRVNRDIAPIKIFASVCVSQGVHAEDLSNRGSAILALARKLQEHRPVDLYVYADLGPRMSSDAGNGVAQIPIIRLETSPLDLASASYVFSDAGFLRKLCFNWAFQYGFSGGWAWSSDPRKDEAMLKTREALQAGEQDLVVPGGFLRDPLIRDPIQWLKDKLAIHTTMQDAA